MSTDQHPLDRDGWTTTDQVVDSRFLEQVAAEVSHAADTRRGGVRNLLAIAASVQALARSAEVRHLPEMVLGPECFVTKATLFDKTPDANWKVAWHQDLTIAVQSRVEVPGFGPWSVKAGTLHVQAPRDVLERMLAVRVHLDDCDVHNGPLRVIPGSHRHGRLTAAEIEDWKERVAAVTCPMPRGGILAMRPLLLHASSAAAKPGQRRVVHFEFAVDELPLGLEWAKRVR